MFNTDESSSLILAAEDYPLDKFSDYHRFSNNDRRIISKLISHGPVLLKGGRGSGKSALMIEASRQLLPYNTKASAFGFYISLRHLDLLRSEGAEYENLFCKLLISRIQESLDNISIIFDAEPNVSSVQIALSKLSNTLTLQRHLADNYLKLQSLYKKSSIATY
ncbi:MAG: hypothetical protein GY749_36335 [Desulfobacteraceae bacterium]|nr:hypothetical protein [Desulfobacteraceae bacterium]